MTEVNYGEYTVHPVADLFPLMEGREFEEFAVDIQMHGLHQPIVVRGKQIIDGRNRFRAAVQVGADLIFKEWEGDDEDEITQYIISSNTHRRHLNPGQKAMLASSIVEYERNRDRGPTRARGTGDPDDKSGRTDRRVAAQIGVGHTTVSRAIQVREGDAELARKVERGEITLNKAYKLLARQKLSSVMNSTFFEMCQKASKAIEKSGTKDLSNILELLPDSVVQWTDQSALDQLLSTVERKEQHLRFWRSRVTTMMKEVNMADADGEDDDDMSEVTGEELRSQ